MMEFEPELEPIVVTMPDKCRGCGVQCELSSQLADLLAAKRTAEWTGENLMGEAGEHFDKMVEAQVPEEAAEDVKQGIRKSVGEDIDDFDKNIEELKGEIDANALSCSGVLKMRASKGDVTYTTSICTSSRVYIRDAKRPQHLPAHIKAKSSKQSKHK